MEKNMINTAAELAVWARFLIALLALSASYMFVLGMVFKYEGGLYEEHLIPSPVTDDMRRARRFFVTLTLATAAIAGLGAYGLSFVVDHSTFVNVVWPALGGVGFGMLYGGTTRYDRIRPRDRA
jgi:hypothetical protein